MAVIVIDAGHGGFDNGAMYQGRKEKDDNLKLALAVGEILKRQGYDVVYTRTTDIYQSPYEKAQIGNEAGADYFISFHRNSAENDNTYNGVQTLIYGGDERAERLAENINEELEKVGFANLGIEERTGLVVLRRTEMPAVLLEVGFINHDRDNRIFDEDFYGVANAIADGIENAVPLGNRSQEIPREMPREEESVSYGVEVGRSVYETSANYLAEELMSQGFQSHVFEDEGMLHVIVGRVGTLEEAVKLQAKLRLFDYPTMIVSSQMEGRLMG